MLNGKTQVWMAEQIGVKKQEIDNVAAGRYRSGPTVDGVARIMSCTTEWLLYGVGDHPLWWGKAAIAQVFKLGEFAKSPMRGQLPDDGQAEVTAPPRTDGRLVNSEPKAPLSVSSIAWAGEATAGGGYTEASQDPADWEPVPIKTHWRLVRVRGTSAVPVLLPGQAAIVDDTVPIKDGRLVCVQTHDGRCFIKRWNTVGDHVVLAGINGGHESTVLHRDEIAAKAVVVGTLYVDSVVR